MVREYFESVLQENGGQIAEYAAENRGTATGT